MRTLDELVSAGWARTSIPSSYGYLSFVASALVCGSAGGAAMTEPETRDNFFVRDDDGRPYRCTRERLTATESRWMVTDTSSITQVGPPVIPDETQAEARQRMVEWLRARKALGHWKGDGRGR
jgi:hypothetical protein